ncbi:Exosome complex component CSL4 [Balamuthia mandrillaris]
MGSDLSKLVEDSQNASLGTLLKVSNPKKKIQAAHIKKVSSQLPQLTSLSLLSCSLKAIPPELAYSFTKWQLHHLTLSSNEITTLPKHLDAMFPHLRTLDLKDNEVAAFPENCGIEALASLSTLSLEGNALANGEIPKQIWQLSSLTHLNLANTHISAVPAEIGALTQLVTLNISNNALTSLCTDEAVFSNFVFMKTFQANNNSLSSLPSSICELRSLRILKLSNNQIKALPKGLTNLQALEEIHLDHNKLVRVVKLHKLPKLKKLFLHENQILEIPTKQWTQGFPALESLTLEDNPLDASSQEIIAKSGSLALVKGSADPKLSPKKRLARSNSSFAVSNNSDKLDTKTLFSGRAKEYEVSTSVSAPASSSEPGEEFLRPEEEDVLNLAETVEEQLRARRLARLKLRGRASTGVSQSRERKIAELPEEWMSKDDPDSPPAQPKKSKGSSDTKEPTSPPQEPKEKKEETPKKKKEEKQEEEKQKEKSKGKGKSKDKEKDKQKENEKDERPKDDLTMLEEDLFESKTPKAKAENSPGVDIDNEIQQEIGKLMELEKDLEQTAPRRFRTGTLGEGKGKKKKGLFGTMRKTKKEETDESTKTSDEEKPGTSPPDGDKAGKDVTKLRYGTLRLPPPPPVLPNSDELSTTPRTAALMDTISKATGKKPSSIQPPEYFPKMLAADVIDTREVTILRVMLMSQNYIWMDQFVTNQGITRLLDLLKKNAGTMISGEQQALQLESLRCIKIILKVRLRDVMEQPDCCLPISLSMVPWASPRLKKAALKLLIEIGKVRPIGPRKVLEGIERLTETLAERVGAQLSSPTELAAKKRGRFRLCFQMLVNFLGNPTEQDLDVVEEDQKQAAAASTSGSGLKTSSMPEHKEKASSADKTSTNENKALAKDLALTPRSLSPRSSEKARYSLRWHTLKLINVIVNTTEHLNTRVQIRKGFLRANLLQKLEGLEKVCSAASSEGVDGNEEVRKSYLEKIQQEIDSFKEAMDEDKEEHDIEMKQKKMKPKAPSKKKTKRSKPPLNIVAVKAMNLESPTGGESSPKIPGKKKGSIISPRVRSSSYSKLELATKSKSAEQKSSLASFSAVQSGSTPTSPGIPKKKRGSSSVLGRVALAKSAAGASGDEDEGWDLTGDSSITESDNDEETWSLGLGTEDSSATSDGEEDSEFFENESEKHPFENYFRITVVTQGTDLKEISYDTNAGYLVVPFELNQNVNDIINKVKSQYPQLKKAKFDWGLFVLPTDNNADGLWPEPHKSLGAYDLKGQVTAEYKIKPWILKITCNATDVINTLTITKMRFDPHSSCADAVAAVRQRFPHVSAWDEYDWGLYWHRQTNTAAEKSKDKKKGKSKRNAQPEPTPANSQEEGEWLEDTESLIAYEGLYNTQDILELKMKMMGVQVKLLSQDASEYMQFDPNRKISDILKDIATKILPESEMPNYTNYGLFLETNPNASTSEERTKSKSIDEGSGEFNLSRLRRRSEVEAPADLGSSFWLAEDKKLNYYKFHPEDVLRYMLRCKPIMVMVYHEKPNATGNDSGRFGTFSRRESRLLSGGNTPIYTHFPIDFMSSVAEAKKTICEKVKIPPEQYDVYYKKSSTAVVVLDMTISLHAQNVDAYARLLLVKQGIASSVEEVMELVRTDKSEDLGDDVEDEDEKGAQLRDGSPNILFEDENPKEIKAGSLNAMLAHLVETDYYEPEFTKAFLSTHHAFSSSELVLRRLLRKYDECSKPEVAEAEAQEESTDKAKGKSGLSKSKLKFGRKAKGRGAEAAANEEKKKVKAEEAGMGERGERIQRRILYLFKVWVDEFFDDFHDQLMETLIDFLNKTMQANDGGSGPSLAYAMSAKILKSIEAKTLGTDEVRQYSERPPQPRIPRTMSDKLNFFVIDEIEVARQLTIRASEIFNAIRPSEFFGQPWSKPSTQHLAPNLMALIEYFNFVSRAVATELLQQKKIRERVKVFNKFIRIAEELKELNNFHLLQAFMAGFSNSAVLRLKWTKAKLAKTAKNSLEQLEQLTSMESSFKHYRTLLAATSPPAIPYVGVCLQDLTFIEDGNRNKVGKLINFQKHKLVHNVITTVTRFQKTPYNLEKVESVQNFLAALPTADDKKLYALSLKVEPRNAGRVDIK